MGDEIRQVDAAQIQNYPAGGANRIGCQCPQRKRKNGVTEAPGFECG